MSFFFSEKEKNVWKWTKMALIGHFFEVIWRSTFKNEVAVFAASRPADASVWIYRSRWYGWNSSLVYKVSWNLLFFSTLLIECVYLFYALGKKAFSRSYFPVPQKIGIFVGLLPVCALLPALVQSQWITGPLVANAAFYSQRCYWEHPSTFLLVFFPSSVALFWASSLAPMVPFIMIANAIYVKSFSYGKHFGFWFLPEFCFLKFVFLTLSVIFLFPHLLVPENAERLLPYSHYHN